MAPRRPHSFTTHGITVVDDYAWLKDAKWQEVLRDPSILDAGYQAISRKPRTTTPKACSATPRPCRRSWSRRCAGGSRRTIPACRRRMDHLPICENSARAASTRCSAARRAMAATYRSCSTATRWPHTTNISSSAVRGIRRITGCRPGAPTPRARNIFPFACATGRPARITTISSRRPTARVVWSKDATSFFYVKLDDNHRPMQVWRHRLGDKQAGRRAGL